MPNRAWAEPALRRMRFGRTVRAAQQFDDTSVWGSMAQSQPNFEMRSAMDLGPAVGRRIAHRLTRSKGGVPSADESRSSTFIDEREMTDALESLRAKGHYAFRRPVAPDRVARMREHALTAPAQGRGSALPARAYPIDAPEVGRYDIDEEYTLSDPDMQDFCTDLALARLASLYLERPVIQDQTALWWTNPVAERELSLNAMQFHQDRDRLLFLKFFVYLTDVGPENGPHTFIEGTHRQLPRHLRSDGRKTDEEIRAAGLGDRVVEHTGPAGTILAVDTIALHKGTVPKIGSRCVLQVEYATSLFGAVVEYPKITPSPLMRDRLSAQPAIFRRLIPTGS